MRKKIFLFLCCLFWAKVSFAYNIKQHMLVHLGVFDAAEIDFFYTFDDISFDIKADVVTRNVFDVFYPFQASYEAKGKLRKGKLLSETYAAYSKTRNHIRTKQIFYNAEGIAYKRVSTKDKKIKTARIVNVPNSANAADLQSVFAAFIMFYKEKQSCRMVREIYDGKKHYKIWGEDKGTETKYVDFLRQRIQTKICNIVIKNLTNNNDALLDASADRVIKLWLGTDIATEMPFVVEIGVDSTPLGALKVTPVTLNIQ